jgi:hypothetical protein
MPGSPGAFQPKDIVVPILIQLAAMWVAKDIAAGRYPAKIAIPLSLLVSRVGAPGLVVGAIGLALNAFRDSRTTTTTHSSRRETTAKKGNRA